MQTSLGRGPEPSRSRMRVRGTVWRLRLAGRKRVDGLGGTVVRWPALTGTDHTSGTAGRHISGRTVAVSGDDSFILAQGAGVIADSMTWSPVSDWLLYSSSDHISVVKPGAVNGGEAIIDKAAYELVLGLDWLPDESGFVFAITGGQFGEENSNVYLYNFEENSLSPLTNYDDEFAGGLTVSPDGQKIVYEFANNPGDPPQLRIMNIDGGNNKSLGIQGEMPDWKPGSGINYSHRLMLPMVLDR